MSNTQCTVTIQGMLAIVSEVESQLDRVNINFLALSKIWFEEQEPFFLLKLNRKILM